jgi:parallel beta-helix repeat protein
MLILLCISMITLTLNVPTARASGTVYIRADGSIDPATAPIQRDGNIYTFLADMSDTSIAVEKDYITLDGNGHSLQGSKTLNDAIDLSLRKYVTITRMVINDLYSGIFLNGASHCTITNNTITGGGQDNSTYVTGGDEGNIRLYRSGYNHLTNNKVTNGEIGILMQESDNNILEDNRIEDNFWGVMLLLATNNTLRSNSMKRNKLSFYVGEYYHSSYVNNVDMSNTVDGKPIYYWIGHSNEEVPRDAGCVIVVDSVGITLRNLAMTNNDFVATFAFSSYCVIESTTTNGINLEFSDYNVITNNSLVKSMGAGIFLADSKRNTITYNNVINTTAGCGIWLEDTYQNTVIGNNVENTRALGGGPQEFNGAGILVDDSPYCIVTDNNLRNNTYGIVVGADASRHNLIARNIVTASAISLVLAGSDNTVYHNNFLDNHEEVRTLYGVENTLDDGPSSGGNYWGKYAGADQNGDGIGDKPYIFDTKNIDRYPLMSPYGGPPLPRCMLTIDTTAGGTTNPDSGGYWHSKGQKIPVQAIPNAGFTLNYWELDGVTTGSSNPITVTMDSAHSLCAVFEVETYGVTISAYCTAQNDDPIVDIIMDGLTTGYKTPHTFRVPIGPHAFTIPPCDNDGHPLKQWNTGESGSTITVSSGGTYTATYDVKCNLTILNTVGGSTSPVPATYSYWTGTAVAVNAFAEAGYYLDYWVLDGVNVGAPDLVNVEMSANHVLSAVFTQLSTEHDVAIKYVSSKTVVGQGCSSTINVKALNAGSYAETFNVTVYANFTAIAFRLIMLYSGNSTLVDFRWNTTDYVRGNYTISAYAEPVQGETDTANNGLSDGWVFISIVGDTNGDKKVDLKDVFAVARAFGSYPGHPKWNPNCDLDGNNKVDLKDYFATVKNYGKF